MQAMFLLRSSSGSSSVGSISSKTAPLKWNLAHGLGQNHENYKQQKLAVMRLYA